jgi:hypothetical protein
MIKGYNLGASCQMLPITGFNIGSGDIERERRQDPFEV